MSEHICINKNKRTIVREDCLACMKSDRNYLLRMVKQCRSFINIVTTNSQYPEAVVIRNKITKLLKRIEND